LHPVIFIRQHQTAATPDKALHNSPLWPINDRQLPNDRNVEPGAAGILTAFVAIFPIMNLKFLPLTVAVAILCCLPFATFAADVPEGTYFYLIELEGGGSCFGSSKLKPEEFALALAKANTAGEFLQLNNYRTDGGGEASVGFINPHYIVRFRPANPPGQTARPSKP
jgi:hypothetical protein